MSSNLSNDVWKNWDKNGRQEFIHCCTGFLKHESGTSAFDHKGNPSPILGHVNQLIDKGIKGVLKKEAVISVLQELVAINSGVASVICDILNVADGITSQTEADESKDRANFCSIVKDCENFLSEKLLKERLEIETLQEVGILKNRTFYSKFIKIKTKLYYKQRKFNLFREECEGFAKLQVELNKEFSEMTNATTLIDIVHSLIGCFNLDPNRVLDIILESFENKTKDAHIFVPLIKSYINDPSIITEVLCTKLAFLKNCEEEIPASFYVLLAYLLQHGLINLDNIYSKLTPDDKVIQKDYEKTLKDATEYVRKLQIISINNKEKEDEKEEPESFEDLFTNNQKLRLCEALISIGDWKTAKILIDLLPEHYAMGFQSIALALCRLVHLLIEPLYSSLCAMGSNINRKPVARHPNLLAPAPAQSFKELKQTVIPMLLSLGSSLHYDPVLLSKIIRLFKTILVDIGVESGKTFTAQKTNSSLYYDIISIFDVTILPSLSYLECNCCIAEEIWNCIKLYPYQIRYCLYARWKNDTYSTYPELMKKRGDSEKQIKNIMKRVSKENVKPVGRLIGKLTHCSPGFLFDYVLLQIQVYSNLINPVVDSLKYLTSLSYDVLGYCIIENLTSADKKRVKHDSTSISMWLQSLAIFSGAVYKKYSIELTGLLQYVANQLKAQKSLDLFILKEVVQKMAGVEPNEDSTMDQLNAMSGGELLKAEAGYFSQIRNTKKSSFRLKEAMNENDLAVALCLLMAQQNYCVVYKETQKSHLKLVGKLSDQCQDTLVQFGTFLGSTLTVEEYINKLPSIQSMLLNYHIPTEVAFFLARPMFNHSINQRYDQLRKSDQNYKKMSTSLKHQKYYEAVQEVMQPVHSSLLPLHPTKTWEDITPQFLATFWSLTMYDLCVPEDVYQQVINKTKQSVASMDSMSTKGKKEQERYASLIEKLLDEKKKQTEHVEKVLFRLKQEKDGWFLSRTAKSAKTESITRFLQLCLFPRCTFTQIDAIYCAKFVHTIHMLKTPNFSTLLCYDRIFCDVTYSIISCTENEALRYGRFLYAMLETVMRWHKSKDVFEKECSNYPGFMTKYRVSNHTADSLDNVGFENYRHVCHKWHYKLAKAVVTCLESKDYVQIRNSLIILIKIIPFFPVLIKLAQFLEKRIEKVRDEEKNNRQDLFTLSSSYLGQLKQRLNGGYMMKESDFHIPVEKDKITKSNPEANSTTNGKDVNRHNGDSKDKLSKDASEKKVARNSDDTKSLRLISVVPEHTSSEKERREDKPTREDLKIIRKEEKRIASELERDIKKERKEEKDHEERSRRGIEQKEERYIEIVSPKDEHYPNERQDRFYEERGGHYHKDLIERDSGPSGSVSKHSQDAEPDRDIKRRKLDMVSPKIIKYEERKGPVQQTEIYSEKVEKKERSSKTKERRDKLTEEEKELKKDRRVTRKRDRMEEALQQELTKRRRDEEKGKSQTHQNGDKIDQAIPITREKHHRKAESRDARDLRELSPQYLGRDKSHERSQSREKQLEGAPKIKEDS